MTLLLTTQDDENVPKSMEPGLKFSYSFDKITSLNFGLRTPTDFEYVIDKKLIKISTQTEDEGVNFSGS